MLYKPSIVLKSVLDINIEILEKMSVKGLILDVDNTLTTHGNPNPADGILEWIQNMKTHGIKLVIVSNNNSTRVEPFAKILDIPFVCASGKPFRRGYNKAQNILQLPFEKIAAVGDQIFTDVWGGNAAKIKTIFVFPIELEKHILFKIKRIIEKPFMPKI